MLNKFKQFAAEQKNGFCEYVWSDKTVKRGKQTFAIFGNTAYDVSKMKFNYDETCVPGTGKLCVPINGKFLAEFPDEGKSGIMGMYIISRNGKKIWTEPCFVPCGWLYTEELKLTNNEILQNMIDEIDAGKNVFTNPLPGWY